MYCQKCGQVIDSQSLFCENCGEPTKVRNVTQNAPINQPPIYYTPTTSMHKKKKSRGKIALIIIGGIFGLYIINAIMGNFNEPEDTTKNIINSSSNSSAITTKNTVDVSTTIKILPIDINVLLENENSIMGVPNQIYRVDTNYPNADGSYNVINFETIKAEKTFTSNNGVNVSNVIVIENVPPINQTRGFVADVAYWLAFDELGTKITVGDIYTQTGSELSEIIVQVPNVEKVKYLLVGGLDSTIYQSSQLIFKVQH